MGGWRIFAMSDDPFLELYNIIAAVVLNVASWILDKWIAVLDWLNDE
jgi:hypothetical protein